jgi:hypothetical protein
MCEDQPLSGYIDLANIRCIQLSWFHLRASLRLNKSNNKRPRAINNNHLVVTGEEGTPTALTASAKLAIHYVLVCPDVWNLLNSWYSSDVSIPGIVAADGPEGNSGCRFVEWFPMFVTVSVFLQSDLQSDLVTLRASEDDVMPTSAEKRAPMQSDDLNDDDDDGDDDVISCASESSMTFVGQSYDFVSLERHTPLAHRYVTRFYCLSI